MKTEEIKNVYEVGIDVKLPVTTFRQIETDSFEEVELVVSRCVWTYSDATVEVFKNGQLIKHLNIKRG